jgi:hypothetical protein
VRNSRRAEARIRYSPTAGRKDTIRGREHHADLVAIGYPDETTAFAAADEARRLVAI